MTVILAAALAAMDAAASAPPLYRPLDADILPALGPEPQGPSWMFGPRLGYLKAKDADDGVWFGGLQARLFLVPQLALEGSIEFHQSDFFDEAVTVTQYPVQATALLYPFEIGQFKPYALGGGGWYYTRTTYDFEENPAEFGGIPEPDTEVDHVFGVHVGAGVELTSGTRASLSADIRWIFLDEPGVDNSKVEDEEQDYWQFTAAINLRF
jgi:hypothetical protein